MKRPNPFAEVATVKAPEKLEKIGFTDAPLNRTKPSVPQPSTDFGKGDNRTQITTYFTKPDVRPTPILYNGDRMWARVTLTLETAGPVAIGNMAEITPVLSGRGQLLPANTPMTFTVAKGTRLYIASTSVNRVKVTIEPMPWLEQLTGLAGQISQNILALFQAFVRRG